MHINIPLTVQSLHAIRASLLSAMQTLHFRLSFGFGFGASWQSGDGAAFLGGAFVILLRLRFT